MKTSRRKRLLVFVPSAEGDEQTRGIIAKMIASGKTGISIDRLEVVGFDEQTQKIKIREIK